ncbi:hypothetical protein, partial [Streptomyces sp. NPDC001948]
RRWSPNSRCTAARWLSWSGSRRPRPIRVPRSDLTAAEILHNGYTVQVSNSGSLRIYRDDAAAGTSTQLANTAAGTTLTAGTVYTLRCVVTTTQITVSVPEAGVSTTVTDKVYRVPWSVFVGRNYNASASGLINIVSISTP